MDKNVSCAFHKITGGEPEAVYFAPGRVNLIGEHIDYNGGHVFPCALSLGTYGAFRKREDRVLRMYSVDFPEDGVLTCTLDDIAKDPRADWTKYVKGVVWAFAQRGHKIETGFDFVCGGNLPSQSGLSSSASLQVLVGTALREFYGFTDVDAVQTALYAQLSENQYVGLNCGIMDQFASAMGKKDQAIFLNTATLEYKYAPIVLPEEAIVMVNSHRPHTLSEGNAYNERRADCEEALADLKKVLPETNALCALTPEVFFAHEDAIRNERAAKRARHAVTEEARTIAAYDALLAGDLAAFGELMRGSHESLRDDFEVSCPELDVLAEIAWETEGVVGARMTGGGFGGCTVNIVKKDALDHFIARTNAVYTEQTGLTASFYTAQAGDGAHRIA